MEKMYNIEWLKTIKKKRGTKIHVATYAISANRDDCKHMSLWSMAQTSRLLLSRREHNSE